MKITIKLISFSILLLSFLLVSSCDDDTNWDLSANKQLLSVMKEYYLWYNQLPTVNASAYENPQELMEVLRVNPPDKWSYVTTKEEYESYFNSGTYYGFGFGNAFDSEGKLWIIYAFRSSPLRAKGIGRGWQISSVDGVAPTVDNYSSLMGANKEGLSKTIGFISPEGASVTYTFSKAEISMNTVLLDSVYSIDSKKIGYLVLNSFIEPTYTELDNSFAKFKSEGVSDLVVDLRYNGGGSVDVSKYLASYIGGGKANEGVYATYTHNDKHPEFNNSIYFESFGNTLSIDKVVFITTSGTASASELVINGLKPYMTVALVGSKTHGKPVGMYVFEYKEIDWVFVPICFSLKNANGVGDYYDGLAVDVEASDDYTSPFGDVNEDSFSASLTYLGVSPVKRIKTQKAMPSKMITGKGLYEEIGAW